MILGILLFSLRGVLITYLLDIPVMIGKFVLLILIVMVIETTLAKVRLFKVLDYLAGISSRKPGDDAVSHHGKRKTLSRTAPSRYCLI